MTWNIRISSLNNDGVTVALLTALRREPGRGAAGEPGAGGRPTATAAGAPTTAARTTTVARAAQRDGGRRRADHTTTTVTHCGEETPNPYAPCHR